MGDSFGDKQLAGIPWRLALALQADGWYLRADIIWAKPNPMPESVTDRPTKSHEYVFLLSKGPRYFYDAEAVRENLNGATWNSAADFGVCDAHKRQVESDPEKFRTRGVGTYHLDENRTGRNARTVWTIPTQAYPDAHFATFPEELPRRCIAAGTSERGCCPRCGAGWVRVVEETGKVNHGGRRKRADAPGAETSDTGCFGSGDVRVYTTTGWRPGCTCEHPDDPERPPDPTPCTVLDPFLGSGTTLAVAARMGRRGVGIELNPSYADLAEKRIQAAVRPNTARTDEVVEGLFTNAPSPG
jgi:hypothetical protein